MNVVQIDSVEAKSILREFASKSEWEPTLKEFLSTLMKVLENTLDKPNEEKFLSVKKTVPKLFGTPECPRPAT